ncbi:phosphotransferase enzyme family protein [Planctomicrobium piriforme]|uniref:Ser/Thr protein kinase RdoA involved in Cpx stress response, MazF antagonist n=1 Tax=Planctomicrobium piriforme TaxID=1576369 RepID=A0A1I3MHF2_9PLAN|nr:phosphotransferase [Planctomicrobium piriforme]SFI96352.1 Ser/Thr protein kinase RdoA involved in Cpx stress response, MazF antagonist [Planctomicrobium piriforme]
MLESEILCRACAAFGLRLENLKLLGRSQNLVYEHRSVEDSSILRISTGRWRTITEVESELAWMDELAAAGIATCRPLQSNKGRLCELIEEGGEQAIAVHFEHAPGRKIERAEIDEGLYQRFGRLTAQLHASSFDRPLQTAAQAGRLRWDQSRLLVQDLDDFTPARAAGFRRSVRELIQELRPQVEGRLGLVHGDLSFSNMFLDGERLWIFDFDNCEIGSIEQDFSVVLFDAIYCRLLNRVSMDELAQQIRQRWMRFLEGYCEVRTLPRIDPELLRKFLILREGLIYIHYCRTLDFSALTDATRAAIEEMRQRVEDRATEIELAE